MKKKYPYSLNIAIATASVLIAALYIYFTVPGFIDKLQCAICGDVTLRLLRHYWYRWCLYAILVFAAGRLYMNLIGARRLYYIFFAGAIIVAIIDSLNGFQDMTAYDITMDVVTPITLSIIGVIYFTSIYKATLRYR